MRVMLQTGGDADRVFDMITTKMGAPGIDILYELVTTRGGSRAAARADEDVLKDLGGASARDAGAADRLRPGG